MGKNLGCRQHDLTRKSQSPNLVAATQSPKSSHGLGTCTLKSLSKGLISTSSPVREREFEESEVKKKCRWLWCDLVYCERLFAEFQVPLRLLLSVDLLPLLITMMPVRPLFHLYNLIWYDLLILFIWFVLGLLIVSGF